jgi:hypothetical protein
MAFVYDEKTDLAIDSKTGLSFTEESNPWENYEDGRHPSRFIYDNMRMVLSPIDRGSSDDPKTGKRSLRFPHVTFIIESEIEDGLRMISKKSGLPIENLKYADRSDLRF